MASRPPPSSDAAPPSAPRSSALTFEPGRLVAGDETEHLHTMTLQRVGRELVYFVSDLHLGDGSHADIFQNKDEHFLAFLDEVERRAKVLVIVGDALDFDQAWYFSRIVRAHGPVISRLTRLAEKMRVIYVYGNHDPDIVLFRDILKWELCDKVVVDGRMLAVHGWEFDRFVGGGSHGESVFWARVLFAYERLFKTWVRLPLRDYYTLSNRFAHYVFYWLARGARLTRRVGRRLDRPELGARFEHLVDFWTRGVLGDPMGLTHQVIQELGRNERFDTILCGHSHVPGVVETDEDKRYINLGSWSFGNSQYGVWDGEHFLLRDWISGREFGDENYRLIFDGRDQWRLEDWFADQYLGWLRFRCGEEALRSGVRPPVWSAATSGLSAPGSTGRVSTIGRREPPV